MTSTATRSAMRCCGSSWRWRAARSAENFDWVARYGGEEFVVVLPDTGSGAGDARVAEKIAWPRARVTASQPSRGSSRSRRVLAWRRWMRRLRPWCRRSQGRCCRQVPDAALYRSKREGRNRVTVADRISKVEQRPAR